MPSIALYTTHSCLCATRPKFYSPSSRIRVDLLSYKSKMTDKREQYNWRAEKIGRVNGNFPVTVWQLISKFWNIFHRKFIHSHPNFSQPSRRIRVDLLLYESKTTDALEQNDWRAEKNLDGFVWKGFQYCVFSPFRCRLSRPNFFPPSSSITFAFLLVCCCTIADWL